jgi:copper homeostasis protein
LTRHTDLVKQGFVASSAAGRTLIAVVRPLLQVVALTPGDVAGAVAGGADRLEVLSRPDVGGLTPDLDVIRAVRSASTVPIRVRLRLREDYGSDGGELSRLIGVAQTLIDDGIDGFSFGFVSPDLEVDVSLTRALGDALGGVPWTFHRAVDHVLSRQHAYRALRDLRGLDSILTAGSARGMEFGVDELCRDAAADPDLASVLMAGGGLRPEDVPWLARAGVRAFHVGSSVRPGRSSKAYVDGALVRSWRSLVDDSVAAAL